MNGRADPGAAAIAAFLAVVAALALWQTKDFTMFGSVFPRTIGAAMLLGSLGVMWRALRGRGKASAGLPRDGLARSALLILTMLLWIATLEYAGFLLASTIGFIALALIADRERLTLKRVLTFVVVGFVLVVAFQFLFQRVLGVRLPAGVVVPALIR